MLNNQSADALPRRPLASTDLQISPVALGCWPMAGISSIGVDDAQSIATIHAALEYGINHFDTAYSYGYDGRSDRLLRQALQGRMDQVVIASKVGSHYAPDRTRILDASPARIFQQADEIRQRLDRDCIDILYLHTPDGTTPIEQSAQALAELVHRGAVRYVGLSNATLDETRRFASVVEPVILQPPFNMLQQQTLDSLRPYLNATQCATACYWPLMKGLLSGSMLRDHVFEANDKRLTYPIYQGQAWQRAQDLLDDLRSLASEVEWSVTRLVVHWTLRQYNVTTVLCGAKRPEQIIESAMAMQGLLAESQLARIDAAIARVSS